MSQKRKHRKKPKLRLVEPVRTMADLRETAEKVYEVFDKMSGVLADAGLSLNESITAVGALALDGAIQWNEALGLHPLAPDGFVRIQLSLASKILPEHRAEVFAVLLEHAGTFQTVCTEADLCKECGKRPIGKFGHEATCSTRHG